MIAGELDALVLQVAGAVQRVGALKPTARGPRPRSNRIDTSLFIRAFHSFIDREKM